MSHPVDIWVYTIAAIVRSGMEEVPCGTSLAVTQYQLDQAVSPDDAKAAVEQAALKILLSMIARKGATLLYYTDATWTQDTIVVEEGVMDHGNGTSTD